MERELNSTFTEWMLAWLQQNENFMLLKKTALAHAEAERMDAAGYEPEAERDRRTR